MYRVRLQVIRRSKGDQYFMYLPRELVEKLGWEKGDELAIAETVLEHNVETNRQCLALLVYRTKDLERVLENA